MRMGVRHLLVLVLVRVVLRDMEPHTQGHERECTRRLAVTGSANSGIAATAPMNGAVEK